MRDAVIVEAVRTPVGKRNGGLSAITPADLSALVLDVLVERAEIDPRQVMAQLRPAYKEDGKITAGTSSQIGDGSAALLMTTSDKARELGLNPIARIHTAVLAGGDAAIMLTSPIAATAKALRRSGLAIDQIGAFEVDESFASLPLAWLAETGADEKALNPNGGAIAIGHPRGASSARIMTTLVHHLRDNDMQYGFQTMSEGGGQANATILELI